MKLANGKSGLALAFCGSAGYMNGGGVTGTYGLDQGANFTHGGTVEPNMYSTYGPKGPVWLYGRVSTVFADGHVSALACDANGASDYDDDKAMKIVNGSPAVNAAYLKWSAFWNGQ